MSGPAKLWPFPVPGQMRVVMAEGCIDPRIAADEARQRKDDALEAACAAWVHGLCDVMRYIAATAMLMALRNDYAPRDYARAGGRRRPWTWAGTRGLMSIRGGLRR